MAKWQEWWDDGDGDDAGNEKSSGYWLVVEADGERDDAKPRSTYQFRQILDFWKAFGIIEEIILLLA